jgi:hypothetical protein
VVGFEFNAHDLRRTTATALAELGYDSRNTRKVRGYTGTPRHTLASLMHLSWQMSERRRTPATLGHF